MYDMYDICDMYDMYDMYDIHVRYMCDIKLSHKPVICMYSMYIYIYHISFRYLPYIYHISIICHVIPGIYVYQM